MKTLSKFLTPALSASDRKTISGLLGLDQIRFLYHEASAGFSHLFNVPGKSVAALSEQQLEQWIAEESLDFALVLDQPGRKHCAITLPPSEPLGLWEALMPFPLDRFATRTKLPAGVSLRVFPTFVEHELHQLQIRIKELEEKLSAYEATILWLESGETRFPLLLHFVRKKLVRVGTAERLFEVGERFEAGQLNESQLDQAMGTRSCFLPIHVFYDPGASPLQNLAGAIERAHLHFIDDPRALLSGALAPGNSLKHLN